MKTPNLFLIGSPRSGSTSLYFKLKSHPEIYGPNIKELKYFGREIFYDHPKDYPFQNLDDYLKVYSSKHAQSAKYRLDGTIFIMYSEKAIKNILEMNKDAKFILILRDPLEASKSMHRQRLKSFNSGLREISEDFYACWQSLENRKLNIDYPKNCRNKFLFRYDLLFRYEIYIPYIKKLINQKNILYIDYSTFKSNPAFTLDSIFNFLKLKTYKLPLYNLNNEKGLKNNLYNRLINFLFEKASKSILKNLINKKFRKLIKTIINFLLVSNKNPNTSMFMDNEIKNFFKESYIEKKNILKNNSNI